MSITDEGEAQSVKSQAGVRKVPIHSELLRLGFLDYVAMVKGAGCDLLWPVLATRKGKPGGYFSHWFGIYRRSASVGFGMFPDFHCLRHTVRSRLAEAEVPEQVMDALVGHEVKGRRCQSAESTRAMRPRMCEARCATVTQGNIRNLVL